MIDNPDAIWNMMNEEQKIKILEKFKRSASDEAFDALQNWSERYDPDDFIDQMLCNVGAEVILGSGRDIFKVAMGKDKNRIKGTVAIGIIVDRLRGTADKLELQAEREVETWQ